METKYCKSCKTHLFINQFRIHRKKKHNYSYRENICKKCDAKRVVDYRTGTPAGMVAARITQIKTRCKKKNIEFSLTKKWMLEQLEKQEWKCALTGLPMKWNCPKEHSKQIFSHDAVSVDRINPYAGYTPNNVRFIINQVNFFKGDGSDEQMYQMAEALISHRKLAGSRDQKPYPIP